MLNTILGAKKEMGQSFIGGLRIPVTKVVAGPCVVTQIKRPEKDGYWAVQLGFGERKVKNVSKPLQGHLASIIKGGTAPRYLREIRPSEEPKFNVGDTIFASDIFNVGDAVVVTGTSKGKGFAGVVKRHGFAGGPRTHGQSDRERAPGSIGQTTTPGRVYKGKRMAGRMGTKKVTLKNLHVISVDPVKNELTLSGSIPGREGGLIIIKKISSGTLRDLGHETVAKVTQQEKEAKEEKKEKEGGGQGG